MSPGNLKISNQWWTVCSIEVKLKYTSKYHCLHVLTSGDRRHENIFGISLFLALASNFSIWCKHFLFECIKMSYTMSSHFEKTSLKVVSTPYDHHSFQTISRIFSLPMIPKHIIMLNWSFFFFNQALYNLYGSNDCFYLPFCNKIQVTKFKAVIFHKKFYLSGCQLFI